MGYAIFGDYFGKLPGKFSPIMGVRGTYVHELRKLDLSTEFSYMYYGLGVNKQLKHSADSEC